MTQLTQYRSHNRPDIVAAARHHSDAKEGSTQSVREDTMKANFKIAIALVAGAAVGGAAVQGLHAQAQPPVYTVNEIDVTNVAAYEKEVAPLAQAGIRKAGGKLLAGSQKVTSFEGTPPKSRVSIQVWDSLEQAQAWRNSADYKALRMIGDKYATYRAFAVEGMAR
jgi:uncharacterized protein (DUF1330 family)